MKKYNIIWITFVVCTLFTQSSLFAVTQGALGATSQGSIDISLTINDVVQITGLTDVNFGTYAGAGDLNRAGSFCIYRNGTGDYGVTITTTNDTLSVSDGVNTIPYTLTVNGAAITTSGQSLSGQSGNATDSTCSNASGTTPTIEIFMAEADLQAAPMSNYTSTVTLLVSPE